jgi:serine/threonine-protein kinase
MELLDGASLEAVVAEGGPLPPARVIQALHDVASALVEAHEAGLIHRDIKPANIILCRQGGAYDFPKVVDFGLVKELEQGHGASLTQTDSITGTPLYMSPEAITAPETLDARSDLYSLGAVGYFTLTGQHVFSGGTLVEICSHHIHTRPASPSERLQRPLPRDLESLILACLEKDPALRPSSAEELRQGLAACRDFGRWTHAEARAWWAEHPSLPKAAPGDREAEPSTLERMRPFP